MSSVLSNFGGRYLRASHGLVVECIDDPAHDDWIESEFSILSSGTERWLLQLSKQTGKSFPLGYMNVGVHTDGSYIVSPTAHGAKFSAHTPGCLRALGSTEQIVIGRFQLVAAAAFHASNFPTIHDKMTVVIGSGPVAIGAVFELLRLGIKNVYVVTKRSVYVERLFAGFPSITVCPPQNAPAAEQIIDCIGTSESLNVAINLARPGGNVGLLGSPRSDISATMYKLHRYGCTLFGLHELLTDTVCRQNLFTEILTWLGDTSRTFAQQEFVEVHDGKNYPEVFHRLTHYAGLAGAFHTIQWAGG